MSNTELIAIIFLAWGTFSATMTVITLVKWERVYPDRPSMRWFSFLMRVFATIAFFWLGIMYAFKAWWK